MSFLSGVGRTVVGIGAGYLIVAEGVVQPTVAGAVITILIGLLLGALGGFE